VNMAYQGLKNDPYAPTFNPGWGNHSSFSWNNGPNKAVLTKYGGLPTNLSQTMPRPNYQGFSKGSLGIMDLIRQCLLNMEGCLQTSHKPCQGLITKVFQKDLD